jgi:2-phosphoglycerate kinase
MELHATTMKPNRHHVRWIGGTACAGKTTVARMLAQHHSLHVYHRDAHQEAYLKRADATRHPALSTAWQSQADWEMWYRQSPHSIFERSRCEDREAFEFVLDDLEQMPSESAVLVEGIGLYPELLAPVSSPEHVVLLVADESLARKTWEERYRQTPWLDGYANPQEIVNNFIAWTCLSADYFQKMAAQAGMACCTRTLDTHIPDVVQAIETQFGYV